MTKRRKRERDFFFFFSLFISFLFFLLKDKNSVGQRGRMEEGEKDGETS